MQTISRLIGTAIAALPLFLVACDMGTDGLQATTEEAEVESTSQDLTAGKSIAGTIFSYSSVEQHGCKGTIIGPRHILTAGHCANRTTGVMVTFYDINGNVAMDAYVSKIYRDALEFSDPDRDTPVDNRGFINDWQVLYLDRDIPAANRPAELASSALPTQESVIQIGWLNNALAFYQTFSEALPVNECPKPQPSPGQYCYGSVRAIGADTGGDSGSPLYTLTDHLIVHGDLLGGGTYTSANEYLEKILWATGMMFYPNRTLNGTVYSQITKADWRACAAYCQFDRSCTAYSQTGTTCKLYSSMNGLVQTSGSNSGQKSISGTGTCSGSICPLSACKSTIGTSRPCGGTACPLCSNGMACTQNSDCITNNCQSGLCTGGPSPSRTPATFYGSDTDRRGCTNCDWDTGYWKATCAASEAAMGLSKPTDNTSSHALLCVDLGATGTQKEILTYDPNNAGDRRPADRRDSDWDPAAVFEFECALNEYVAGVSQNPNYFPPSTYFHGLRCAAGLGSGSGCEIRVIQGSKGYSGSWGDWDYSYLKADCPSGKVMVGMSIDKVKVRPHAIYCCNKGTTTRYEAEASTGVYVPNYYYAKTSDPTASQGYYMQPKNSTPNATSLTWTAVSSSAATTRTLEFGVRSTNGTLQKMGVTVNGTKLSTVISSRSTDWEIVSVTAALNANSSNRVMLKNSEGTDPLRIDFLQITP